MQIKVKLLNDNAVLPLKAHKSDAGFDLYATSRSFDEHGNAVYGTGIAMEIPYGFVGLVFPRSSISKYDLTLSNAVGVIDSGYRGEITFKFRPDLCFTDNTAGEDETDFIGQNTDNYDYVSFFGRKPSREEIEEGFLPFRARLYEIGERIGQLIILPIPQIEFETVSALSPSERGEGGYGSSGK